MMNMNVDAMMSLVGNQGVKMTAIAQAMTTPTTVQDTSGFLGLMQSLMGKGMEVEQSSPIVLPDDEADQGESMMDQLLMLMQMAEQKPEEISAALLAFLKQSKEVDLTKIDASWLQSVVQTAVPIAGNPLGNDMNGKADTVNSVLTAKEIVMTIAQHGYDFGINTEEVVKLEQSLIGLGLDQAQASEFSKEIALMSNQTKQLQAMQVVHSAEMPQESQAKSIGIEVVSNTVSANDPKAVMESMRFVRPALVEVNQEELKVLQMTGRKEESLPVSSEEAVASAAVPLAPKHVGTEVILDDSQALKESVMNQVEQAVIRAIEKPSEEFVMKLRPEGLGEITVKMVMNEGGKIVLNIQTQSQEVRSMVSQELNQLRSTLVPLNVEVGEVSSYVSNEGFFQQSAYEQSRQQYQPEMQQKTKSSYVFFNQEELVDEVVVRRQMTGRLSRYV